MDIKIVVGKSHRICSPMDIITIIEYPDSRIKPIVLLSLSTGIRVGAWDYMRWKHITTINNENGAILAAKLVVYPNEPEEYYTFMTPEAYNAVKEWMDFRASFGEEITARVEFYWFNPTLGISRYDANLIGSAWVDIADRFPLLPEWKQLV